MRTSRYRVLGEGSTLAINIVTIAILLGGGGPATHMAGSAVVPAEPEAIWSAFVRRSGYVRRFQSARSFRRSITACSGFHLAVALGIPIGILMGTSRIARGIFDPPIEFYRPLPPRAYLR